MAERTIRTPAETDALCIGLGLLCAARMLREHGMSLQESGEAVDLRDFAYLAGLLEQQAAELKAKAAPPS